MTPTYRRAVRDDAALIHLLLSEMAAEEGGQIKGTPDSLIEHGFGPQPRFSVLLAEDPEPIGLVIYFPEYSTWRGALGLYVQDLYLRPAARGRGLGRALIAQALRQANWGAEFVSLMVAEKNQSGRAFYAAIGFAERGTGAPMILAGAEFDALRDPK